MPSTWSVHLAVDVDPTVTRAVWPGASLLQPAEDTPYGWLDTPAAPGGAIFKLHGERGNLMDRRELSRTRGARTPHVLRRRSPTATPGGI